MDAAPDRFHPFQGKVEDWHWWYRTRREILDRLLRSRGLDRSRARLLDIGCGTGGASRVLSRYGQAFALDAAASSFRNAPSEPDARPYSHRVVGSAESLPFADGTFDVVCALDVIEHTDDDVGCAREIERVLRPGGTAVFFVPAFQILWGQNDTTHFHRRRYTKESLAQAVTSANLKIDTVGYFNMLLFLPLLGARLLERVFPRAMHRVEYQEEPTALNELLATVFALELPLLSRAPMPVGTSAYCVARKAGQG